MVDEKYEKAKKRVEEIKGFYSHLIVYICVNIVLVIINLVTSPGAIWFYWPLLGWGIGLFFHAMGVFVFSKFPGKQWEERKIKEVMKEMDDSEQV
jgi:2TM domain-containing protein